MATLDSMDRAGMRVVLAVFVALVVDGMDLQMLALALPSLMQDLNISVLMAGALGTYTLIGMGIGGILAGWCADRWGRVRVTFWSIVAFSLGTTAMGLAQSYWHIAIIRFLSGFGIAAVYSIGNLMASEYVPTRIRTTVLGALQGGWSVGYVVAALLSAYILPALGWRPLFLCAIVPGAYALWLLRGISDPPSWLASREALRLAGGARNEFASIWADPPTRRTFVLWSLAAIALQFGYYGANTWLPSYLVKDLGVDLKAMGWYVATTYGAMVLGKVITGYLADLFGRRTMWTLAGVLTAGYLPFVMYVATPDNVAGLLLSESFPTPVRGTAVATSYNIGRIGSTLSPLMVGFAATHYSIAAGIALLGISYALCGLIPGLFIREKMYDPRETNGSQDIVVRAS